MDGLYMIHDGNHPAVRASIQTDKATTDRRRQCRVPFPAELVIAWCCDMHSTTRYRIVDVSDDGFRLRTSTPLVPGMTGAALKLLPDGVSLDQTVTVVWCSDRRDDGTYDVGVRRL